MLRHHHESATPLSRPFQQSILLSKLNPETPRIWLPQTRDVKGAICSTEFMLCCPKGETSKEYLYCLFSSMAFSRRFASMVTGTSKSHQRVKQKDFLAMKVAHPPAAVINCWTDIATSLFGRIVLNRRERGALAATRDALLPKLLSGELCVPLAGDYGEGR
jgi:type I restriction enzyme S subunit